MSYREVEAKEYVVIVVGEYLELKKLESMTHEDAISFARKRTVESQKTTFVCRIDRGYAFEGRAVDLGGSEV